MAPREESQEPEMHTGIRKGGDFRENPQTAQARGGNVDNSRRVGYREKGEPFQLGGGQQEGTALRDSGNRDRPSHPPFSRSWSGPGESQGGGATQICFSSNKNAKLVSDTNGNTTPAHPSPLRRGVGGGRPDGRGMSTAASVDCRKLSGKAPTWKL